MTRPVHRVPVQDVFALAVPENIDPTFGSSVALVIHGTTVDLRLLIILERLAQDSIRRQYAGRNGLVDIEIGPSEWFLTRDPAEVEKFQPGDGCAECMAGNDAARRFLQENPSRWIAMANLNYVEVWADD